MRNPDLPRLRAAGRAPAPGFTLVELLVVTAVIGLLAALLFPAAARARTEARRSACVSNLRQIGLAFHLYAANWNDFLPHEDAGSGGDPPADCCWFDALDPYLDRTRNLSPVKQCPARPAAPSDHTVKMNSLLEDEAAPFYRLGAAPEESRTVLLFDGRVDNAGVRYQTKGTHRSAAIPHGGMANVLLLDLHAESFRPTPDGPTWADPGPFVWDP